MRVPLAIKWKSARPCTITERLLFSITFGSTVYAGSGLGSPLGKTLVSVHSTQSTLAGAWIAALTSARSKYKGVVWAWKNDPLARNYRRSEGERDQYLTGSPVRPIGSATCAKIKKKVIRRITGGQERPAHRVENTVSIESWVDKQRCIENHLPDIAALVVFYGVSRERQETLRWVLDVLGHVIRIITLCCDRVKLREECLTVTFIHGSVYGKTIVDEWPT